MNRIGLPAHRPAPRFARRPAQRFARPLALFPTLVLLCCGGASYGQISDAAKRAPNADNAAIQRHIDAAVKNLASDDAEKQAKGREDIAGGVVLADPAALPSAVFLDAYAAAVARGLTPLAQHEDMRVRLNAAIANARVAERAGNTRLLDLTVRFVNDKTSAVALWGVKAARAMLPTVLGLGQNNNPLLAALVQAVQRVGFGPIVTEVYDALSLNIIAANPKPPPNVVKGASAEMLKVFRVRVNGYAGGVPPDPAVDNAASEFLSFSVVWQQLTPPQRVEAVQAMSDLLSFASQHALFMEGEDRQVLMPIFKRTGAALQVIGDALKNAPVTAAAKEVTRISTGMDGSEIISKVDALTAALLKAVPGVKPSPKLPPPPEEGDAPPPDAPPAGAPPANDGKAPAPGANGAAPRPAAPRSATPAPDLDTAQPAGEPGAPPEQGGADEGAADEGAAEQPPAPRAPARPAPR